MKEGERVDLQGEGAGVDLVVVWFFPFGAGGWWARGGVLRWWLGGFLL